MNENKFTTYLLYGVGEILLVVAGILIALQIDNWAEHKKDRNKELFLLNELHREMTENLARFDSTQAFINRTVASGRAIVRLFPLTASGFEDPIQRAEFNLYFRDFLLAPSFDPTQGTIKSIISNGDIDLIQNDSLRQLIVSWEDMFNDYREEELIAWNTSYRFMDWLTEYFPKPQFVEPDYSKVDFRLLQSKIGSKMNRYDYALTGDEQEALRLHILGIIELTEK